MILAELEACAGDVNRKIKIPDPSVKVFWRCLSSMSSPLFDGTNILLNEDHQEWLYEALRDAVGSGDGEIVPKLLYECTNDNKSAEAFHEACDGKGATLTVVRCMNIQMTVEGQKPSMNHALGKVRP